jgi:hypothetical protein
VLRINIKDVRYDHASSPSSFTRRNAEAEKGNEGEDKDGAQKSRVTALLRAVIGAARSRAKFCQVHNRRALPLLK